MMQVLDNGGSTVCHSHALLPTATVHFRLVVIESYTVYFRLVVIESYTVYFRLLVMKVG